MGVVIDRCFAVTGGLVDPSAVVKNLFVIIRQMVFDQREALGKLFCSKIKQVLLGELLLVRLEIIHLKTSAANWHKEMSCMVIP